MFEIDKESFGTFLAEQRKEKGYTQKDLASKLFVSDKAISKWERGLSMPDISLLIPLSKILEVTLTELLEGKKLDATSEMKADHVELLVKKALTFSEDAPEKKREIQKKNAATFGICVLITLLELLVGICYLGLIRIDELNASTLVFLILSFVFGIYFWLFIKDRLPVYYDENKISAYSDGIFRMNIPGVNFNNSNWPYIVKVGRVWTAVTMITVPMFFLLFSAFPSTIFWTITIQNIQLVLYLASLFIPLYIVGKKYG